MCVCGHPGEYGMVKESSLKRKDVSKIPYSIYFRMTICVCVCICVCRFSIDLQK